MRLRAALAGDGRATLSRSADEVPLADAKLSPPRQRRGMVDRRHVSRMLDAGQDAELTLDCGAGRLWENDGRPCLVHRPKRRRWRGSRSTPETTIR